MEIRGAGVEDVAFLAEMLCEAFAWRTGDVAAARGHLGEPRLAVYLDDWGRPGDVGVIATDESGLRVGAAWCRLFTEGSHGFGFVAEDVPEITVAVISRARRRGIGTALMTALLADARKQGHQTLSLSVEDENLPALKLYQQLGFRRVARDGNALTLAAAPAVTAMG